MAALALDTVQDYVTDARVLLQDTVAPYRYEDASLVTSLNLSLLEARRLRPDLFLNLKHNLDDDVLPQYTAVDTKQVPMQGMFRMAILHGMCAHALSRDQEDIQDNRNTAFMRVFTTVLIGVATPGMALPKPRGA